MWQTQDGGDSFSSIRHAHPNGFMSGLDLKSSSAVCINGGLSLNGSGKDCRFPALEMEFLPERSARVASERSCRPRARRMHWSIFEMEMQVAPINDPRSVLEMLRVMR